ncbi:hypothetical protein PR202_ga09464 [Eleusine coracana subsp. coracana]|uniref:Pectinesterase catalytic domain-containing protein n=1 Tax=Eleusine coracana subsp. coracana TaxID=191504 RepID=A0AAV5C324_ELECO|nr:hypothetical protein PR202_ga09464 [Eleusine coracana subsp. coracana]
MGYTRGDLVPFRVADTEESSTYEGYHLAPDGSGGHSTINAALKAAPPGSERFTIHVKKGVYAEVVEIHRNNVMLVGDGAGQTIITGNRSNMSNHGTRCTATVSWVPWDKNVVNITTTRTVFYGEYKNEGPGSDLRHRVSWPGFHKMKHAAQARKYTVDAFIHGGDWLPEIGVAYKPGL